MDIAYSALTGHYYLTEGRKRVDITEPMLAHDARKRAEVIEEVLDKIEEGLCTECEHSSEGCSKVCQIFEYEKEALIDWLKEQKNE